MAVLVQLTVPHASREQMYAAEEAASARGDSVGGPPYPGLMFIAVTADGDGFRLTTAWRNEADFREVLGTALGPDLAHAGLTVADATVTPVLSMAIPDTGT